MGSIRTSLRLVTSAADAGERISVQDAFREYSPYVAAVAYRLLGRDDELDDVVQDVFVAALSGLGGLRDPRAIKQWLATVTVRMVARKLRVRRLRAVLGLGRGVDYETVAATSASPEERALIATVYAVLDELPVAERIAWTLRHVEGERLDAIAQICRCSLATVKRRIAAAQAALEQVLGDE